MGAASARYTTPPRHQGQIVTRSYALESDSGYGEPVAYRRTHDASDGSVRYAEAWADDDWSPEDGDGDLDWVDLDPEEY